MRDMSLKALKILLVFGFLALFMYSSTISQENTGSTEYIVKSGDSLSKIAKKFGVTVGKIKTENGLKTDLILIGQKLIIPSGSKTPDYQTSDTAPTKIPEKQVQIQKPVEPEKKVSSVPTTKEIKPIEEFEAPEKMKEKPKALPENNIRFDWSFFVRKKPQTINKYVNIAQEVVDKGKTETTVSSGDKIAFFIRPDEHTFVYLFFEDSLGSLELLYPTSLDDATTKREFTPGMGTSVPGVDEWFSFDENEGQEKFIIAAFTERQTNLENLYKNYQNSQGEEKASFKQRVINIITEFQEQYAFLTPIELGVTSAVVTRGLNKDITKEYVQVQNEGFYSKTIKINHINDKD